MTPAYVQLTPARWCVLRAAEPGGRITSLCADSHGYGPVCISTADPGDLLCSSCAIELRAGTPGAARAVTVNLRRPADDPEDDWGGDSEAIRSALHEDLLDVPVEVAR